MKVVGYIKPSATAAEADYRLFERPTPAIGPEDLLVRVRGVAPNPVDYKVRAVRAGADDAPVILGWDGAGEVEAVGAAVQGFAPGDRVMWAGEYGRDGSFAERQAVDHRLVGRAPASLDLVDAAALPMAALTAWEALFDGLRVPRDRPGLLLIVGGAGGVGSMAVQLARALTGLTVVATASRPETAEWARGLGAHHVIDHRRPLSEALAELGLGQADYVFGTTHTERHWPELGAAARPFGRITVIEGPQTLDTAPLRAKSLTLAWTMMFSRSEHRTADMAEQGRILTRVAELVDAGRLKGLARERLGPLSPETLRQAHARLESGTSIGKMVLEGL